MKCESCGNELTGGAIICRVCNHNNALRGGLRKQRSGPEAAPRGAEDTNSNPSRGASPMTELPKIVPRKDIDANLIHFPPASINPESVAVATTSVASRSMTEANNAQGIALGSAPGK